MAKLPTTGGSASGKQMEIRNCECKHEYQSAKYGANKRAMNPSAKGFRCTVCGKEYLKQ